MPAHRHRRPSPDSSIRQSIARAVTSSAADQDSILNQIAASSGVSKTGHDLLASWSNGEIYLYTDAGGQVVPIILEQSDTTDKTRAFRVDTGELLKDPTGTVTAYADATGRHLPLLQVRNAVRTLRGTAELGVASDRPAAAVLRIAGMPAAHYDLELAARARFAPQLP